MLSAAGVVHHGGQALVQQRRVLVEERVEQRLVPCHEAAQPVFKRASEESKVSKKKKNEENVVHCYVLIVGIKLAAQAGFSATVEKQKKYRNCLGKL